MSEPGWPSWLTPPPTVDELVTDDGEPMETPRHRAQMNLLIETLDRAWAHRDDFYAGGNMFVYYSALQAKHLDYRGPDFFVVLDTDRHRERKAWVLWEEDGKGPDVIIELLSESTAEIDRGPKKRIYGKLLRVPEYFLYDPFSGELDGYVLDLEEQEYRPLSPTADKRLVSRRLDLCLGRWQGRYQDIEATWLRWFTPAGDLLATGDEAADAAKAEADAAKAEAGAAKAEAGAAKAEAGAAKAEAATLAGRLAEYERRFGKLPGGD